MEKINKKFNFSFTFFVMFALILFSCKEAVENYEKESFKIQVAFESDFYNSNFIDTLIFSKPVTKDTSDGIVFFDEYIAQENKIIGSGTVTISAISVLERIYSKTINITSDTSVIFENDFPKFEYVEKWADDIDFDKADTIVVYFFNGGCYMSDAFASKRKIIFINNGTNFIVKYTDQERGTAEVKSNYKTKNINRQFLNNVQSFYLDLKAVKERESKYTSTSNTYIYFRIDNKIYEIADPNSSIGIFYDKLIKEIKLQ